MNPFNDLVDGQASRSPNPKSQTLSLGTLAPVKVLECKSLLQRAPNHRLRLAVRSELGGTLVLDPDRRTYLRFLFGRGSEEIRDLGLSW